MIKIRCRSCGKIMGTETRQTLYCPICAYAGYQDENGHRWAWWEMVKGKVGNFEVVRDPKLV